MIHIDQDDVHRRSPRAAWRGLCALIVLAFTTTASAQAPAPAPDLFVRYSRPQQCAAHTLWREQQWWSGYDADTVAIPRTGYREQATTVAAIRACLARFSLRALPKSQLLGYGQAALAAHEDALADSAFTILASSPLPVPMPAPGSTRQTWNANAWALFQIVASYLGAPEPNLPGAERYLARLDAMEKGTTVLERMLAHQMIAIRAHIQDSVDLEAREWAASYSASRGVPRELLSTFEREVGITHLGRVNSFIRRNLIDSARTALDATVRELHDGYIDDLLEVTRGRLLAIGKHAPPLQEVHWYGAGVAAPSASVKLVSNTGANPPVVRPQPGHPSLIAFDAKYGMGEEKMQYDILRRLASKYAARAVDVTFFTRTNGWWERQRLPKDSVLSFVREHFLTTLKLPVTLAVAEYKFLKNTDGDIMDRSTPVDDAYVPLNNYYGVVVYLVDKNGVVRMVTDLNRVNEAMIGDVLESLL